MKTASDLPGSQALRKGRYSCSRHIYFITSVCADRNRLFLDTDNARIVSRLCHDKRIWSDSKLLAWVLMPDHWHGIIELGENMTLSKTMQAFKSCSAKALNAHTTVQAKYGKADFMIGLCWKPIYCLLRDIWLRILCGLG